MNLDADIDALYQQPPGEFVRARNALAKTLSGTAAAQVRALPKPTVPAWSVNQLYWRDRRLFDRLVNEGSALRRAQIATLKGRDADVRGAATSHREVLGAAVQRTIALARDQGVHVDADAITRTLEALSLSPENVAPGRLAKPLQPAGFEALAGVRVVAAPAARAARPAARGHERRPAAHAKKRQDPERAATARLEGRTARSAAQAARKADMARRAAERRDAVKRRALERAVERARREEERARRKLAESEKKLADAELRLRAL